jgi:RNA polymerase sigma-70 factor (ECF subfamily)
MTSKDALEADGSTRWQLHMRAVAEQADRQAFHALYLYFAPKIKSFYLQQGMAELAEELTHEVFIRIWQKAASYNPEKAQVSTWIFTIVRNLKIDYLRKKKIVTVDEESTIEPGEEARLDEVIDMSRNSQQLKQKFTLLNQEQRNVIQKVYFEDKSHQITANELKMTLGTVKSRIRSALSILRKQMGGDE